MGKKNKPRDIEDILRVTTKLEVASFIGANVLLFGMFFYLFDTLWYYKLAIGVIISVLNFLIIKTDLILDLKRSEKKGNYPFLSLLPEDTKINLSWRMLLVVMTRYFVFNMLSDMFPSFLGWVGIYGVLIILPFDWITLAYSPDLIGTLLTGVGVVMGIFQFYKKYYMDEIIISWTSTLDGYFKRHLGKLSLIRFLDFLREFNNNLYKTIERRYDVVSTFINVSRLRGKSLRPIVLHSCDDEVLALFIESKIEDNKENINDLKTAYKRFFKEMMQEIKKDIDKQDLSKLRAKYIANIFLFNSLVSKLSETTYALEEKVEEPESFAEFRLNAAYEMIGYFIKKMLEGDEKNEK